MSINALEGHWRKKKSLSWNQGSSHRILKYIQFFKNIYLFLFCFFLLLFSYSGPTFFPVVFWCLTFAKQPTSVTLGYCSTWLTSQTCGFSVRSIPALTQVALQPWWVSLVLRVTAIYFTMISESQAMEMTGVRKEFSPLCSFLGHLVSPLGVVAIACIFYSYILWSFLSSFIANILFLQLPIIVCNFFYI